VGAGVVALSAGSMTDAKTLSESALKDIQTASMTAEDIEERTADAERASRDNERAGNAAARPEAEPWVLPLESYTWTSPFGVRWAEMHTGVDLSAPEGTPYRAVHAGVVKEAKWLGGYGYGVVVDHGNGIRTVYGHSSRLMVRPGQQVKAGEVLGEVGSTGYSYAPHLHFELQVNGVAKDPVPFMRQQGADIRLQVGGLTAPAS
ncbi:MAG TPA: M23 family metallopeptidase, partial [Catenuloplanes sp.]